MIPIFDKRADGWEGSEPRVLVFGPPGTGKTTTMLDAFLVPAMQDCDPSQILACSFSRAAAGELRTRLAQRLGCGDASLRRTCTTTHAEAWRAVQERYGEVALYDGVRRAVLGKRGKRSDVASEPEPADRMAPAYGDAESGDDVRETALRCWDFIRQQEVKLDTPQARAVIARLAAPVMNKHGLGVNTIVADIERYEAEKAEHNAIDFTDMLIRALDCPVKPRQLLVQDEQQDATPLQHRLFKHWAKYARRVAVVGDDSQAIHEWAGVRYEDFVSMAAPDSGYTVRRLAQSYRVPALAHDMAMQVIKRNTQRVDSPYLPADRTGAVHVGAFSDVAATITARESATMLVLARSAHMAHRLAMRLCDAGIPAACEVRNAPYASRARALAFSALGYLQRDGSAARGSLAALVADLPVKGSGIFSRPRAEVLREIDAGPERQALPSGVNLANVPLELVAGSERNANAFMAAMRRWGPQILEYPPNVVCTTMHRSKGREADAVAVLDEMTVPTAQSYRVGDVAAIEAERRLLYVTLTRTKDILCIEPSRQSYGEIPLDLASEWREPEEVPF